MTRQSYLALAVLTGFAVIYGSWLPFDFRPFTPDRLLMGAIAMLHERFTWHPLGDYVENLALLVPFGFFLAGALAPGAPRAQLLPIALLVILAGLTLSCVAEIGQIFLRSRTPSLPDIVRQTNGNLVGLGAWFLLGPSLDRAAGALLAWCRRKRLVQAVADALGGYLPWAGIAVWMVGVTAAAWSPFDFDLRGAVVRARLHEFLAIPFANYESAPIRTAALSISSRCLAALPFGILLALARPRWAPARRWLLVSVALAALVFVGIEAGQMLLATRYPDITDAIIGVATTGAAVYAIEQAR